MRIDIALGQVADVDWRSKIVFGDLTVRHNGSETVFDCEKADGERLTERLRGRVRGAAPTRRANMTTIRDPSHASGGAGSGNAHRRRGQHRVSTRTIRARRCSATGTETAGRRTPRRCRRSECAATFHAAPRCSLRMVTGTQCRLGAARGQLSIQGQLN